MIKPGWRKANNVCPVCHMPGRVGERVYGDKEPLHTMTVGDMQLYSDYCDNCGVFYAYKAEKAEIPELTKEQMAKAKPNPYVDRIRRVAIEKILTANPDVTAPPKPAPAPGTNCPICCVTEGNLHEAWCGQKQWEANQAAMRSMELYTSPGASAMMTGYSGSWFGSGGFTDPTK